jgi:hypothetical protein
MAGMTAAERYDEAYQKMLRRVQLELADEHATPSSRLDTLKMRRVYLRRECISAIEAAVAEERARWTRPHDFIRHGQGSRHPRICRECGGVEGGLAMTMNTPCPGTVADRSKEELPGSADIIDENFTGGLRSEDYLDRLRDGAL